MLPVLSREVVEGKQRVAILDQALDSVVVFDAPSFDEGVERGECILLGLGHPDLLERTLGLRSQSSGPSDTGRRSRQLQSDLSGYRLEVAVQGVDPGSGKIPLLPQVTSERMVISP